MYHAHLEHYYDRERPKRAVRIIGIAVAGVLFASLFALLFGWLVMLLWNWLMPLLFGLRTVSYWQAFGITVLSKILFSGVHPPRRKPDYHRWHREKFHHWLQGGDDAHCSAGHGGFSQEEIRHYHSFWEEQGEAAFREYLKKKGVDGDEKSFSV